MKSDVPSRWGKGALTNVGVLGILKAEESAFPLALLSRNITEEQMSISINSGAKKILLNKVVNSGGTTV